MVSDPLYIRFGQDAARVWCDDLALRQSLARYFRHSLEMATPVVIYQFAVGDNTWQLSRNDLLLFVETTPQRIIERFLQDVTAMLIRHTRSRLLLHAAGIARGDKGIIICGRSGSGKSTLAAWLTASGFDFLTDELLAIQPDNAEMYGFTRPLILKKGSDFVWQHWLSPHQQNRLHRFSDDAIWLDPEVLRDDCVRIKAHPQLILYPLYRAGSSLKVTPLSSAESMFRLMQQLVNTQHLPDDTFPIVSRLATNTSAFSVTYGDVAEAASWIKAK